MSKTTLPDIVQKYSKGIHSFLVLFYAVGIVGFVMPQTSAVFLNLTAVAILLSLGLLSLFHKGGITNTALIGFVIIYAVSFAIEAIGVNTGVIFGHYYYGNALGIKIFGTPLIIGINWVFLVYTTSAIADRINTTATLKVLFASTLMFMYDIMLEQVASKLDMWYWRNDTIPLQNYIAWFLLSITFHLLLKALKIKIINSFVHLVFICQFMFFVLLFIFLK